MAQKNRSMSIISCLRILSELNALKLSVLQAFKKFLGLSADDGMFSDTSYEGLCCGIKHDFTCIDSLMQTINY